MAQRSTQCRRCDVARALLPAASRVVSTLGQIQTGRSLRPKRSLVGGDGPQVDRAALDLHLLFGFPVTHVEGVGDDAGAGLEVLPQLGPKLLVQRLQQVERYD